MMNIQRSAQKIVANVDVITGRDGFSRRSFILNLVGRSR